MLRTLLIFCGILSGLTALAAPFFEVKVETAGTIAAGQKDAPPATIKVTGNADWRGTVTVRSDKGQLVRILYLDAKKVISAGQALELQWDGTDEDGFYVPAGKYTVHAEAVSAEPICTLGNRTIPNGIYTDVKLNLDPRLDCWYLARGCTQGEEPFAWDDSPESLLRRLDFDGLPLGPELGLRCEFLGEGNLLGIDIHGDYYWGSLSNPSWQLPRLYKFDGRTGEVLWTSWLIKDKATGKPRAVDGTPFDGENLAPGYQQWCQTSMWDTDTSVWDTAWGMPNAMRHDIKTGEVLETRPVHGVVWLVGPDGSVVSAPNAQFGSLDERDAAGKTLWSLDWTDINQDGDLLDPPDANTLVGESKIILGSDHSAFARDVEGNSYARVMLDVPDKVLATVKGGIHKIPEPHANARFGAILKYDTNGQLLMFASYSKLAVTGQWPHFGLTKMDVSEDGKLVAWGAGTVFGMNAADYTETAVEVKASPAQALRRALPGTWQGEMLERLTAPDQAGDLNRGRLFLARKDYPRAATSLKRAATGKDPDIAAVAYHLQALALWRQGKPEAAAAMYHECATKLPAEKARALIQEAVMLADANKLTEAVVVLRTAEAADATPQSATGRAGYWAGKARVLQCQLLRQSAGNDLAKLDDAAKLAADGLTKYPLARMPLLREQATALMQAHRITETAAVLRQRGFFRNLDVNWVTPAQVRPVMEALRDEGKLAEAAALVKAAAPYPWLEWERLVVEGRQLGEKAGIRIPPAAPRSTPEYGKAGDRQPDAVIIINAGKEMAIAATEHGTPEAALNAARGAAPGQLRFQSQVFSDDQRLYVADNWYGPVLFTPITELDPAKLMKAVKLPTIATGTPKGYGDFTATRRPWDAALRKDQEQRGQKVDPYQQSVGVWSDGKTLYASDSMRSRVLIFSPIPQASGTVANFALGQPTLLDGTANFGNVSASTLDRPQGIWGDGKYLWVCDRGNHRVLRYTLPITGNKQAADLVLGQPDFTSAKRNNGGLSAATMNRPSYVFSDGRHLVVSDTLNQRVLIWNSLPTRNGQPADVVLGQPDGVTSAGSRFLGNGYAGMDAFANPNGVYIDNGTLYVCDTDNSRVLFWNILPTKHGQPADDQIDNPGMPIFAPISIAGDEKNLYVSVFANWSYTLLYLKANGEKEE